jgi:PAS domain S-box-containing protein
MNELDKNLNQTNYIATAIARFSAGYLLLSKNGTIKFCSSNILNYFGTTIEELQDLSLIEFVPEYFKNDYEIFIKNIFQSKELVSCKLPVITVFNHFNLYIVKGIAESEDECFIMLSNESDDDLTVNKYLTGNFPDCSLADMIHEGIGVIDGSGGFVYSNSKCDQIFGVEHIGLKNRSLMEFIIDFQQINSNFTGSEKGVTEELIYEWDIKMADGTGKKIRASFSCHFESNENHLFNIGIFSDITLLKKNEKEIENRLALERKMNQLSTDLIHIKGEYLNNWIDTSLKEIGEFSCVDRSYIFLFSDDNELMSNTNEWCNEGVEPQKDILQDLPVEMFSWWMEKLKFFEIFHVPVVAELPDEAKAEKDILEAQDIKSVLILPLISNDTLIGFIGFDSVKEIKKWSDSDIQMLSHLGEIYGEAVTRIKFEKDLNALNKSLENKVEQSVREIESLNEINRLIIENTRALVIKFSKDGVIESVNPFAKEILGLKSNELTGDCKFSDLLVTENNTEILDKPDSVENIEILQVKPYSDVDENIEFYCDYRNELKIKAWNDVLIDVIVNMSKIKNNHGSVIGYVLVGIDISERKKAEELLKKSEMENRAIVQAVPDMMFKLSREGVFIDFINNNRNIPLQSAEYFKGKKIEEILPNEISNLAMLALENTFQTGHVSTFEYQLKTNEKEEFYENKIIAVGDNEAFSFVRDITDRKIAETELRSTTQSLSVLIQSLNAGILFEDKNRKIKLTNHAFCEMFEIESSPDLMVGADCAQAAEMSQHMMKDPDGFLLRIKQILENGNIALNDEMFLKNGKKYVRDYIPVKLKNELIGHLWNYRDITYRKNRETYAIIQRDMGFEMAASGTIDKALQLVVQSIIKIDGIHAAGIYLLESNDEVLRLKKHTGLSDEFVNITESIYKDDFKFQMVQSGISRFGFEYEFDDLTSELFRKEGIKYAGTIPIMYESSLLGTINIASHYSRSIDPDGIMVIETISSMFGSVLERLRIENELFLSQKNLNLMFETIDDFMFILDTHGQIIKTNPVVEIKLGYTTEELFGKTVLDVHSPDRREEAATIVQEMLQGKREVCPIPLIAKDGKEIPVETKVVLGKWDGNDVIYGISRDITERLKAEKELRRTEARWQFALEGMGDGLWDINLFTMEVYFSPQWKMMLGYTESELENKYEEWESRIHPDDYKDSIYKLEEHIRGNNVIYTNEHRLQCKNGEYKWILNRGKVIEFNEKGEPYRMIGTHTDITARKNFENQLKKTIETEKELNELKSRFVSTASHEFRTPLASILMLSDIILNYQHRMDNTSIREKVKSIKDHVIHLSEIVNDVLKLSKIKEGKVAFDPTEFDIITICVNIINSFMATVQKGEVLEFKTSFQSLVLKIDKLLIIQALSNLISNALKYSNINPHVEIELIEQKNEYLLTVKDNGIGIPEEDQTHLFVPFFRAGNVETIQGNGLGLSIAKESVELHGGYISFISKLKIGTSITLHLPKKLMVKYKR